MNSYHGIKIYIAVSKKISSGIGAIKRLKPSVDLETLKSVYNALVLPNFDYCCEVWDSIGITLSDRLYTNYKIELPESSLVVKTFSLKCLYLSVGDILWPD